MYYDKDGVLKAAGAEAEITTTVTQAEDEGWTKAELLVHQVMFSFIPSLAQANL